MADRVWRLRAHGLEWRDIESEVVILDLPSATYFSLNGTGRRLWLLLQEPATADELVDDLARNYAVPRDTARHDVDHFITDLAGRGLVEEVP